MLPLLQCELEPNVDVYIFGAKKQSGGMGGRAGGRTDGRTGTGLLKHVTYLLNISSIYMIIIEIHATVNEFHKYLVEGKKLPDGSLI